MEHRVQLLLWKCRLDGAHDIFFHHGRMSFLLEILSIFRHRTVDAISPSSPVVGVFPQGEGVRHPSQSGNTPSVGIGTRERWLPSMEYLWVEGKEKKSSRFSGCFVWWDHLGYSTTINKTKHRETLKRNEKKPTLLSLYHNQEWQTLGCGNPLISWACTTNLKGKNKQINK